MASLRYSRPALKTSVDVQLQSAFADGNWNAVVRLAAKRAATLKDPYYEALKMCAESQLDGTAEKCGLLVALDELIKNKKTPDIDIIELYEWACRDFFGHELDYADTLGPLRARWAKANPSTPQALKCLQVCLERWDLVSAQQIATSLDKTYANSADRRYMFWNITLTYLLSISPQCTDASRKVYSLLALRHLARAADLTENSDKLEKTDRGLLTEEEIGLYYRVLRSHGTREEYMSRLTSPKLGALAQLREGHKLVFWEGLDALEAWGEWDRIYALCRDALALGLDTPRSMLLVCDLQTWKRFITAASKAADPDSALGEVQSLLKRYVEAKDKAHPMHRKNINLALLELTFRLPASGASRPDAASGLSPRVAQIGLFLEQYLDRRSAFDDVKPYVAELTLDEIKSLLDQVLPKLLDEGASKPRKCTLRALDLRLRYLLSTCPQTLSPRPADDADAKEAPYLCSLCGSPASLPCAKCLRKLVVDACSAYKEVNDDKELADAVQALDKDPRIDLALVISVALLKLSGLQPCAGDANISLWRDAEPSLFLQAVLLLDAQLRATPGDTELRLLLIQLYLRLGCVSYAHKLWTPLDVKRTIQDALSPLFFDRISALSPGLFQGTRPPMEGLRTFFTYTLADSCPVRIWDAFSAGSYPSILDMVDHDDKLRRSCTVMMTLVEERRATRCFGGKIDIEIDQHPLTETITEETTLLNKTDYGSLPNLESSHGAPIQEYLRLGPGLSNERSHLSFLAEQYLDLLLYRPPKDYKPSRSADVALRDREYTLETLSRLSESLTDFLQRPATASRLTALETTYFTVLSALAAALLVALSTPRSDPVPKTLSLLTKSVKSSLASLRTDVFSSTKQETARLPPAMAALPSMTRLAALRDTALAIKHSAAFVTASHERELARDRSGRSGVHRDALTEMRALGEAAGKVLGEARAHVQRLKEQFAEAGWLDRVLGVAFPEDRESELGARVEEAVGGRAAAEEWAAKVVESWRDGVKGWGMVRWE
ncbi:hypothetical protein VTJ83DRAFT_3089 [Remersonia thermophila]|uniref:N-acetyltransferase B complex non catalytic subunit-domain-containing protein n=1 Tax=Remersonia thermophila TaxID=72144 RepID=A0ABR4DD15_9PEZI